MNVGLRFFTHLFRLLVRLHPSSFKQEFEDEMRDVFTDGVVEAYEKSWILMIRLCPHELKN